MQAIPNAAPSTPQVPAGVQQPTAWETGLGQRGSGAIGAVQTPPITKPQVFVAAIQQGAAATAPGMKPANIAEALVQLEVPHGTAVGAAAPPAAGAAVPLAPRPLFAL